LGKAKRIEFTEEPDVRGIPIWNLSIIGEFTHSNPRRTI
jgi:hypothetical protein